MDPNSVTDSNTSPSLTNVLIDIIIYPLKYLIAIHTHTHTLRTTNQKATNTNKKY